MFSTQLKCLAANYQMRQIFNYIVKPFEYYCKFNAAIEFVRLIEMHAKNAQTLTIDSS